MSIEELARKLRLETTFSENVVGCFTCNYADPNVCTAFRSSGCKHAYKCKHMVSIKRRIVMQDVYKKRGYANRNEYLKGLADEYGVDIEVVLAGAEMLGPSEDFDGLINMLEDL